MVARGQTAHVTIPPSKIGVPRVPVAVIARPRLFTALQWDGSADSSRVALICAPAGYGKTTLLAQHAGRLRGEGRLVAWMSCDRHDSDSAPLWRAVLAALSAAVCHESAGDIEDPFDALTVPPTMDRAFLAELTEAVDALPVRIELVLDDFHEIGDAVTLSGVADFLRNLPDRLSLIISSRRDPAIPLHRLRLDGRLREIRGSDLAFGTDEIDQVLRGQDVRLELAELKKLCCRTEGWPAAVRLASMALADEPDRPRFVAEFAGDDSAVSAYLVAEILSRQPEALQRFLLDTCVADELTVELAARLSERADAGAVLDRLEKANALVQRLGRHGDWYRYHALLRSYLLAELRRRDLDAARTRHRSAALWFDDAGMPRPAIEHAVAAGDEGLIRGLLSQHGLSLMLAGNGTLLSRAVADSPAAVRDDPEVLLLTAVLAYDAADCLTGDRALDHVRGGPIMGDRARRLAEVAHLYQARLRGDTEILGVPGGPASLSGAAEDDVALLALVNRGALRIAAGDYVEARADLTAALDLGLARGHDRLALDCMNQLSGVTGAVSLIGESASWARRTAAHAADHGWATSPQLAYSYALGAWCAHLVLDLDNANRQAGITMAVLQGGAIEPEAELAARSSAAVVTFDRYPHRRRALRDMDAVWAPVGDVLPSPALIAFAQLAEMRMCLTLADRGLAAAVVSRVGRLLAGTGDALVIRALDVMDHQRHDRARALIAPVLAGDVPVVVVTTHITAWLVEALATTRNGMTEPAHRALLAALALGESSGVLRPFYDLGQPVHDLLVGALGRVGHLEPFLAHLLEAWREAEAWQNRVSGHGGDTEHGGGRPTAAVAAPLTAREIEVLRELPSLLTADEIAVQHQVSVNTVKTHMRSLYRKLGTANRREAVAVARRLSLL
ncbi:LuxR family transcriptional regulator [Pseudonocardia sulfidoxydans NBRC 16205]|uniref:LuxR family transcriptional regulator n=2 Tax=Pseudonocardia sulfidoxydans TaxID=54011 RepID=A0A511D904_9PSEU|nr:LuxR family transcriptional regulator [Pseudonocardia sulfidoxydans NBRC 16205]